MPVIEDVVSILKRLNLKAVVDEVDRVLSEFEPGNSEERFKKGMLYTILEHLENADKELKYMGRKVVAEGRLVKNEAGRYEIEGTDYYFTSGSVIEVLIEEDDPYWVVTSIEHNGEDYYATRLKGLHLNGAYVRVR